MTMPNPASTEGDVVPGSSLWRMPTDCGAEIALSAAACQQELLSSCMQRLQSAEDAISCVRDSLGRLCSEIEGAFTSHVGEGAIDASPYTTPKVRVQFPAGVRNKSNEVFDALQSVKQGSRLTAGLQAMDASPLLRKEAAAAVAGALQLPIVREDAKTVAEINFLTDPLPLKSRGVLFEAKAVTPASATATSPMQRPRFHSETSEPPYHHSYTGSHEGDQLSLPPSEVSRPSAKVNTKTSSNAAAGPDSSKSWHAIDAMAEQTTAMVDQVVVEALDTAERKSKTQLMSRTAQSGSNASLCSTTSEHLSTNRVEDVVWSPLCCGLQVPTLHPEGSVKLFWVAAGFIFICFEVYWVPFALSFEVVPSGGLLLFISVMNTYWIVDIVLTFITGFRDSDGVVERSLRKIGFKYARGHLILDIIAGIPWEWVPDTGAARLTRSIRIVRTMRLLRLARLLRLMKLKSFMEQAEGIIEANALLIFFLGVVRVLFALYGITHWAACIWFVVGSGYKEGEASWLQHDLLVGVNIEKQPWEVYVYSLYFTLTTMTTVGYGDITASRFHEVLFVLALLCVASVVFAGLMGVLMDLITQLNASAHLKQEKRTELSKYLKWRDVPAPLAKCIRQHLVFLWDTNGSYDGYEVDIKDQLPPVLKTDLCYHIYGRVLCSAPFLAWMRNFGPCVKKLSESVYSGFLVHGDHLFRIGEPCITIHFLITGSVHLSRNQSVHDGTVHNNPEEELNHNLIMAFTIPRNHDTGVEDIRKSVADKAKRMRDLNYTRMQQAEGVLTKFHRPQDKNNEVEHSDDDPASKKKKARREKRRNYDIFESDVFRDATLDLLRLDKRRKSAAAIVQKAWRRRIKKTDGSRVNKNLRSVSTMQSKTVQAPAYFGESCLWLPYEDWGSDTKVVIHQYSATCDSRATSEIVHIPRTAISEVIEAFAPWLLERFEFFQTSVLRGMHGAMGTGSHTPTSIVDWAVIDLCPPPQDEASLGHEHFESLRRSSQAQRLPPTVPKLRGLSPYTSESRLQVQPDRKEGSTSSTRPSPRDKDKNGISTYRRPSALSARGGNTSSRLLRHGQA